MVFKFTKKWFSYLFRRNPFQNMQEEYAYVRKLLCKLHLNTAAGVSGNCEYENWLLKITSIPKKGFIYVKMKSRGTGYIFGPRKVGEVRW